MRAGGMSVPLPLDPSGTAPRSWGLGLESRQVVRTMAKRDDSSRLPAVPRLGLAWTRGSRKGAERHERGGNASDSSVYMLYVRS